MSVLSDFYFLRFSVVPCLFPFPFRLLLPLRPAVGWTRQGTCPFQVVSGKLPSACTDAYPFKDTNHCRRYLTRTLRLTAAARRQA